MNKGIQFLSKVLAYAPVVLFTIIGILSLDGTEAFVYLILGLILYSIIGFGLTSPHKEYQASGILSLLILTVIFYLGASEIFKATMTMLYIWVYYAVVYGFSLWVTHTSSKEDPS